MDIPWRGKTIKTISHIFSKKTITQLISLVAVFFFASGTALADQFDDQIAALRTQAQQQQSQAAALHAQANDYRSKVADLNAQINALQARINYNNAQYNRISANIAANKVKLEQQKTVLSANIKTMYLDSTRSPIEMLASNNNFSDFLDQEQYQDKIKTKIQEAMSAIQAIQKELDQQQKETAALLASLGAQREQIAATRTEMSNLLAMAESNAAAADASVRDSNSKVATLKAQQAAAIAAASRHIPGGSSSGCAGYPSVWCNSPQDSIVDSWGMYNRECVSYAAWAASVRFNHYVPYWGGRGNAKQWPDNARAAGIPVDGTPHVGDVAIYMGGTYGHAMVVEKINSGTVEVSSFNSDNTGHYSYDEWNTGSLYFIHFR